MKNTRNVFSTFTAIHGQRFHQQAETIAVVGEIFVGVIGTHATKVVLDF